MASGVQAEDEKAHVKRYIARVVDSSPSENVTAADIASRNLQRLPSPDRRQVLDGLVKEAPKLKGIQNEVREHQAHLHRATRRDAQLTYLDKAWDGRQNWANPTYMPRITEKVSISTTAPLTTITKLAVKHQIALPGLWQPGGELHDAAFAYGEHILTKDKAAAALRAFKLRIEKLDGPDLDPCNNETELSAPESESEEDRAAKRLKHTIERSPSVEIGRRARIPSFDHRDKLFSPEQKVPQDADDDDEYYVALPGMYYVPIFFTVTSNKLQMTPLLPTRASQSRQSAAIHPVLHPLLMMMSLQLPLSTKQNPAKRLHNVPSSNSRTPLHS